MSKKIETGLIIVKEDIFSKIRKNLFAIFFKKENELLNKLYEIEQPRNVVCGKVIIPKEISIDKNMKKIFLSIDVLFSEITAFLHKFTYFRRILAEN